MMKVTVRENDLATTYMVRFHYPHSRRHVRNQSIVYCYITKRENDKLIVIATGKARCVKPDVFSKAFGRKTAFTNAVNMFHDSKVRGLFWDEYLRTTKLPNHSKVIGDRK